MAPSSRSRLRAAAVLGPMLVLVCCRGLVLRSAAHQLYAGEAAGVGRLQWALSQGTFEWHGPARFVVEHTYQYFAQGTAFLQVVAAALSPFFGHTFTAQAAAAIALEALGVGLFAWLLLRITAPAGAALGAVALALPPRFTATFALQPYGNHTEYLWVPLAAALILLGRSPASSRRGWRRG
ncbi:MAG: hypothetical protein KDA24_23730, partial [Deltaproteobacteria bacterium]|nr:hypothetical protein [Deltaproteobacteria bacterium]